MRRSIANLFLIFLLFGSPASFVGIVGQTLLSEVQNIPVISNIEPKEIFPNMNVKVVVYNYGYNNDPHFIFTQNGNTFVTESDGGSGESDPYEGEVTVPEGLAPGICTIQLESNGKRSLPFSLEVAKTAKPPKLISVSRPIIPPNYFITLEGIGFVNNQIVELTDSEGGKHSQTISGGNISFQIPRKASSGLATFRVIENQNGAPQYSNELKFEIRRGAIPVSFNEVFFAPISRGQWIEIYADSILLHNATKIELRLTQGHRKVTSFVSNFRRLYFQVPVSFKVGKMKIQSRTWVRKQASEWSEQQDFEIAKKPRSPIVYGLETIPLKAEAKFYQNRKTIAVLPIYFGVSPRTLVPKKIQNGPLEVFTRYKNKGNFTEWKIVGKYDNFDIENYLNSNAEPLYYKKKIFKFNPFFERLYFNYSSTKLFKTERGTNLVIYGNFFVKSARDLQLLFENGEKQVRLIPAEHESLSGVVITLPTNMPRGHWRISMINTDKNLITKFPVRIKLE